jgi:hypothetical protein
LRALDVPLVTSLHLTRVLAAAVATVPNARVRDCI